VGPLAVFIALIAVVPMMAAVFSSVIVTTLVAVLSVAAAALLAFVLGDEGLDSLAAPLIAVAVLSIVAIIASSLRRPSTEVAAATAGVRGGPVALAAPSQADTDDMTGLLNRRGAIRALGARNADEERVIGFLDCDQFKKVNDEYGSEVGDEFIQAIAGRLRHSLPTHDTVARWDGDEFLVAMSTDATSARPAFQRVVASISSHPIRTVAGSIPASVSVGAAVWAPGQDLEDVIERAGRSLYSAKQSGGGVVVLDDTAETVAG
jgi:diguanylate cyclase (GGDEF)-like protein